MAFTMTYKSDIEIAQATPMQHISDIIDKVEIDEKYVELYGNHKAKINYSYLADHKNKPDGKLILVTAINPTPAGEGKTTTTIGLSDALRHIGKNAVVNYAILDENIVIGEGVVAGQPRDKGGHLSVFARDSVIDKDNEEHYATYISGNSGEGS